MFLQLNTLKMSTVTVVIQRPNTLQDAYTRTLIIMSNITCQYDILILSYTTLLFYRLWHCYMVPYCYGYHKTLIRAHSSMSNITCHLWHRYMVPYCYGYHKTLICAHSWMNNIRVTVSDTNPKHIYNDKGHCKWYKPLIICTLMNE